MGIQLEGCGSDDLRLSAGGEVQHWGRPAEETWAARLPVRLSVAASVGGDIGALLLVGEQDDGIAEEDEGSGVAHRVGKGSKRQLPAQPARRIVGEEAKIAKEHVDVFTVGDGRVSGRFVEAVRNLLARPRLEALPQQLAAGARQNRFLFPPNSIG
jgi:hypothetical protein